MAASSSAARRSALGDRLLDAPAPTSAAEREALRRVCTSLQNAQLSPHYERCLRRLLAAASPDDTWLAVQDVTQYANFLVHEERWGELDAFVAAARPADANSIAREMAGSAAGYARAGRCALALQVLERARPAEHTYDRALDVAETLTYCVSRERGTAELLAWAEAVGERDWMPYRLRVLPADPPFLAPFVELLEARLADDPLDARLNEALAAVLEPFGDFPARLRHLTTWAALAPEKASVPTSIARLLLDEGKHQAAAAAYAEVVAKSPENADAWIGLVEAQLAAGLEEEAARSAEAAAAAGERLSTRLVALVAESRQSWRQAADAWARHLALVPASEILRPDEDRYLAVLKRLGDVEGIASWLAARVPLASNLTSTSAEAWLGDAWRWLGFPARARQHYEAALVADPDDDAVVYGLAQTAADEGRKEEAVALYRRALARNPAEGGRALAVARYLREQGDAEGAIAAIRPAADAEHSGMSWVRVELVRDLRAAGDAAAALALADRLLAENEHANLVRFERGEALAALGREAEARATFDDFLERTASLAAKSASCNCNCEVLSVRAELLARLQPPQGGDAAVAATPAAPP